MAIDMWVIKIGGSLLDSPKLPEWLDGIAENCAGKAVIVPGGGVFADQVRSMQKQWHFDDRTAHRMAILAMRQMALLFQGLNDNLLLVDTLADITAGLSQGRVVLWAPGAELYDREDIPASWDITSDSLSAWLGGQLAADLLVLIKSAAIPPTYKLQQLVAAGVLDKAFSAYLQCRLQLLHHDDLQMFLSLCRAR